jgi:hypothetical protein
MDTICIISGHEMLGDAYLTDIHDEGSCPLTLICRGMVYDRITRPK